MTLLVWLIVGVAWANESLLKEKSFDGLPGWGRPKTCPPQPFFPLDLQQCTLFEEKRAIKPEEGVKKADLAEFANYKAKMVEAELKMEEKEKKKKKEDVRINEEEKDHEGEVEGTLATWPARYNYAAAECGAKIINATSAGAGQLLQPSPDAYALMACGAEKWLVVELCEEISVDELRLANYEFFSSTFQRLEVWGAVRLPDWSPLANLTALNSRALQAFRVPPTWLRYLRLVITAHWGCEHYCPISTLQVFGSTLLQDLRQRLDEPAPTPLPLALPPWPLNAHSPLLHPFQHPSCPASQPPDIKPADSVFKQLADRIRNLERNQAQVNSFLTDFTQRYVPALEEMQETLGRMEGEHRAILEQVHRTAQVAGKLQSQFADDTLRDYLAQFIPERFSVEMNDVSTRLGNLQDQRHMDMVLSALLSSAVSMLMMIILYLCNYSIQVQTIKSDAQVMATIRPKKKRKHKKRRYSLPDFPPDDLHSPSPDLTESLEN